MPGVGEGPGSAFGSPGSTTRSAHSPGKIPRKIPRERGGVDVVEVLLASFSSCPSLPAGADGGEMPSPTWSQGLHVPLPCGGRSLRNSSPNNRLRVVIFDEAARNHGAIMKNKPDPSLEEINKNFKIDDNGIIYRIVRHGGMLAGTRASFVADQKNPYIFVVLRGTRYRAHRICWIWYNQECIPDGMEIDHINRIPSDNRKENLRTVDARGNQANRSDNKSGFPGVYQDKKYGTWRCEINHNNKKIHIGTFKTKEDARKAHLNKLAEL